MCITQVTRENFEELLPFIKESILSADFVTFDTELTGLAAGKAQQYSVLDTYHNRYGKVRHSAINFGLLQYGICTVSWDPQSNGYAAKAWSFYLFPKTGTSASIDRNMLFQLSAIEFLVRYNFDFNLTFSQGIPFLSRTDEQYKRAGLERNRAGGGDEGRLEIDISGIKEEDKAFLKAQLDSVIEGCNEVGSAVELEACNSYRRRLLYQEIPKLGKQLAITKAESSSSLRVEHVQDVVGFQESQYSAALGDLERGSGFRQIIETIISSGKPFIGHNCFMDLCHTFQKFIDRLPEHYDDFKENLHRTFPLIFDTKYVAHSIEALHGAESSSLGDLTHFLASHPVSSSATNVRLAAEIKEEHFHDAGFDALCTGKVFIGLCSLIANRDNKPIKDTVDQVLHSRPPYDLANRLYMMQSDCEGFNLAGDEDEPDRSAIVHLSNIDQTVRGSHIATAFAQIGLKIDASTLIWIPEDHTVLIRLASEEDAHKAASVRVLDLPTGHKGTIMAYETFAKALPHKRRLSTST